jgi:hypothetical protein
MMRKTAWQAVHMLGTRNCTGMHTLPVFACAEAFAAWREWCTCARSCSLHSSSLCKA